MVTLDTQQVMLKPCWEYLTPTILKKWGGGGSICAYNQHYKAKGLRKTPPLHPVQLSFCPPAITVGSAQACQIKQAHKPHTHTHTLACTHWHSPQGHRESKVMSLIYGKGREADIYRQVLVLHTHTVQRAAWNPLISLYTRSRHNSTFILQHLCSHRDRAQIDSRVLRRRGLRYCHFVFVFCFFSQPGAHETELIYHS